MRTKEKQEKNLHNARAYASLNDMARIIRESGASKEDQETAINILNARYNEESLKRYWEADTAIRDLVQDAFEESYYGITTEKKAEQDKMMEWGTEAMTAALEAGDETAIKATWERAKELGLKIAFTR